MAFGITPVTGYPQANATEFEKYLQFQNAGVNLGDRGVRVLNIVGDPAVIQATRGVGENSNVITVSKVAAPAPAGLSVGWANPLRYSDDPSGTTASYLHSNSGTSAWGPLPSQIYASGGGPPRLPRVGLIGYTSGAVVWVFNWAPLVSDPAPTGSGPGTDKATVGLANLGFPERTSAGLLTISATVDGVPTIDSVQMAIAAGSYNAISWGPTP